LGIKGGISAIYTLDDMGEDTLEPIFFIDTNEIPPEDRYHKAEYEPLAKALRFTGEPRWYLKLIC
jgi:hypothetical protein